MSTNASEKTFHVNGQELPIEVVDGKEVAKDKDGNVYHLHDGKEEILSKQAKKPTKIEMKRMQQYLERRKRLINKGVPEDKVDQVIAEEDFNNLSTEAKLSRVHQAMNQAVQRLAQDINSLFYNQGVIDHVLDVNFKAFARCLTELGVAPEKQKEILETVEKEVIEERRKKAEEQKLAEEMRLKAQAEQHEKNVAGELAKAEGKEGLKDAAPAEPAPIPEGATTFGD